MVATTRLSDYTPAPLAKRSSYRVATQEKTVKKVIASTLALSVLLAPGLVLAQPHRAPPHGVAHRPPPPPSYRSWHKGERFDHRYARNYREIDYRRYRGLTPPPRGYHYVQSGNDAVLVGITSGLVAAVIANAIH